MTQAPSITRKLTTILAADAANYSGRMARDEVGTVQALRRSKAVFEKVITERGGRIANTAGDGLIADFPSVVEATAAAVVIQQRLTSGDVDALPFRIGLHLGDVIVEGDDLLGDGVNMAARLQEHAPEGGIFASSQVVDHAKGRLAAEFRPVGPKTLKHLGTDIAVFGVVAEGVTPPIDLSPVMPQVTAPQAPQDLDIRARVLGSDASQQAPAPAPPPVAELGPEQKAFRKTARNYGFATGGLIFADILGGAGPGWPSLVILVLAGLLYRKWRALPQT